MKYDKKLKEKTVLQIINKEATITEMADKLGVHYTTVRDWVRQYRKKKDGAFPGSGNKSASDVDIARLLKENAELKKENEFLKKAAAFFAKSQK